MTPLARRILELAPDRQVRLTYGVMASATTVNIEGSSVAVDAPRLDGDPLVANDYVAILVAGADVLILGKVV